MLEHTEVVVIGGGQAGLAMGYYLAQQGRDFVILDKAAELGHTWRSRYDSLVLFTPAQYNSLPGMPFPQPPDQYPTKDDVADYLTQYVGAFRLPVRLNSPVQAVTPVDGRYLVKSGGTTYRADVVVVATGPFQRPAVPPFSQHLAPDVLQLHSSQYRNPDQLPPGNVLVVGAGNSGAQIAEELSASRTVAISVGKRPVELPQRLLGRDLFWWLHALRVMDVTIESRLGQWLSNHDPIIGTPLRRLIRAGRIVRFGRARSAQGQEVCFDDGRSLQVSSVIWATGFQPDYGWIDVPVFDARGAPAHRRGVTAAPGLYFLGLQWQYRRDSALLGGVGRDAAFLAQHLAVYAQHSATSRHAIATESERLQHRAV